MWFVYMLKCQNDVIYTGMTDDIERRFKEHMGGRGGQYTYRNRPQQLLFKESFKTKLEAEKREQQIKRWSKAKKLALIIGNKSELIKLSKSHNN